MAKRQPTGDLRGLVEPLAELRDATITATNSSSGAAVSSGAKPGGMRAETDGRMALVTSGQLDGTFSQIRVSTSRAGMVGTAEVKWRTVGGTAYNWNPPIALSGFEFIDYSTTATKHSRPHACRHPLTGRTVLVEITDSNTVTCWRQGASGLWSSATVATTSASSGAGTPDICATITPVPHGGGIRFLCFYVSALASGSSSSQIRLATSDDDGATWTAAASDCLTTPLGKASSKYLRIRAAALNGLVSVLLWEQDTTDTVYQYVSATEGATLELVETVATADVGCPDLVSARGRLHVATIQHIAARTNKDDVSVYQQLASASQPLSSAVEVVTQADVMANSMAWASYAGGLLTSAECALLVDDDGDLWLYGANFDGAASKEIIVRHSTDGGDTWNQVGSSSHTTSKGALVFWSGASTDILRDICIVPERGRALMICRSAASTATADDSLLCLALGGWSSVGLPEDVTSARRDGGFGWDTCYIPIETPPNMGAGMFAATGAGTPSLGSSGLTITTAANTLYYTAAPALASRAADGILALFAVYLDARTYRHEVRISDGTNDYDVSVEATSTSLTLTDLHGPTTIGSAATITAARWTYILIALDKPSGLWSGANGRVRAWYRQENPALVGPSAAQDWTQIATSSTLTSGAATTGRVRFGAFSSGTGAAIYRTVAYSDGAYVLGNVNAAESGTTRGRVLPGAESPIHLLEGLRIHGVGGPAGPLDTWLHDVAYDYASEHAGDPWTHPSPRRQWRTESDNQTVDYVWTGLDLGWRSGDILALYLAGCNWKTATLYRDSTGTNKIADISLKAATMNFTRSRGVIIPATSGTDDLPFYAHEDVLVGATVDLGSGNLRKVARNREGAWLKSTGPANYQRTELDLESYDSGDASSGSLDLWMPGGLFLTEAMAATDTIMLRISAQDTADNDYRIGVALLGRWRPMGMQWSRGRARVSEITNELVTTRAGGRHVQMTAPTRRVIQIAWSDGIDTSGLHTSGSAPDHYTWGYTGADPIAAPPSTADTLAGIVSRIGATVPIVLTTAVKQLLAATTSTTPATYIDPRAFLYGRIIDDQIGIDANATVRGDELRDPGEVVTVRQITVSEEL